MKSHDYTKELERAVIENFLFGNSKSPHAEFKAFRIKSDNSVKVESGYFYKRANLDSEGKCDTLNYIDYKVTNKEDISTEKFQDLYGKILKDTKSYNKNDECSIDSSSVFTLIKGMTGLKLEVESKSISKKKLNNSGSKYLENSFDLYYKISLPSDTKDIYIFILYNLSSDIPLIRVYKSITNINAIDPFESMDDNDQLVWTTYCSHNNITYVSKNVNVILNKPITLAPVDSQLRDIMNLNEVESVEFDEESKEVSRYKNNKTNISMEFFIDNKKHDDIYGSWDKSISKHVYYKNKLIAKVIQKSNSETDESILITNKNVKFFDSRMNLVKLIDSEGNIYKVKHSILNDNYVLSYESTDKKYKTVETFDEDDVHVTHSLFDDGYTTIYANKEDHSNTVSITKYYSDKKRKKEICRLKNITDNDSDDISLMSDNKIVTSYNYNKKNHTITYSDISDIKYNQFV